MRNCTIRALLRTCATEEMPASWLHEQRVQSPCGRISVLVGGQRQTIEKETYMRILIPALAAASMLMIALPGYSADDVKSGGTSTKPARALDDSSAVKQGGSTN